jgi:glycosyltransferase involved in cell wall biosynthesis
MKISLITACYNSATTIRSCIDSVLEQQGIDLEYIVVDGGSKDGTVDIIKECSTRSACSTWFKYISEPDRGMYDAINKGIKMATGDVVGILNADDILAADNTLATIAEVFSRKERKGRKEEGSGESARSEVECVYADIRFVKSGDSVEELRNAKTVRYCSAARWRPWMFRFAAMVPHPSFYARRECFDKLGMYSLDYRICADFELVLRFLGIAKLPSVYLPKCVVVMRTGGASTAGWRSNVEINREDLRALKANGVWSCLPLIYLKYLFKIWGFVFRGR